MTDGADGSPARTREVELKYRVSDTSTGERLLSADRIGRLVPTSGRVRSTQLEDRYVDTRDGALAQAGFAVRLRQSGADTIVSVKSLARIDGAGGSISREELEGPADRAAPVAEWPASDARSLVLEHAGDAPLVEGVTIRQLRRKRTLKTGTTRVELSLDEVDVVARGRIASSFVELEAELLKGDERVLEDLARAFDDEPGLSRSPHSKLEAALAAVNGQGPMPILRELVEEQDAEGGDDGETAPVPVGPGPVRKSKRKGEEAAPAASDEEAATPAAPRLIVGKSPGVTADDHVAEAGRKVMRFHLARMIDYEAGTRSGEDAEDLHKMRVATRRQRAAWRVFGESFRDGRTRRYRKGLREIASRLGAVRDLDVLLEAADAYRAEGSTTEQRALEPLLADWRSHRDDARLLLLRELDSDGYRRWLDDYVDFVRTEGAAVRPVGAVQPHRVRDTAPPRIWTAYEQVRGYEPVLRWADVETLHDLRIAGKWLRYTLEFVREALGPESGPLIAKVTALQDHLGLMHDADVAASMARTFLVEHAGDLSAAESAAIGRYLVDRERETARLRRTVGVTWRGVAGIRFRRSLGRVVAGL
jgi:CHAD domain-containing protein